MAALVDIAMAGGGLSHIIGLLLLVAVPVGMAEGLLLAFTDDEQRTERAVRAVRAWMAGAEGASRILATATVLSLFGLAAHGSAAYFIANHRHAWLIAAAITLCVLMEAGLCLALLLPLTTIWRRLLRLIGDPRAGAALLVVAALGGGWAARVALGGVPAQPPDLRPLLVLAAYMLARLPAGAIMSRAPASATVISAMVGVFLASILVSRAAVVLDSDPVALAAVEARAPAASHVLAMLRRATDEDGDGHSSVFGGGDCDDMDPELHPGATDPPGDGLDLDCDGAD